MAAIVSLNGIDEAIKNLDYKAKDSPKLRLVKAIRAKYLDELAPTTIQAIDPDTLVNAVWDIVPAENRSRSMRKNLASLRSSVNLDLKVLFEDGKNPDGIIIGPSNTFAMSDEAKDQMLTSVAASVRKEGPVSLGQITRTLAQMEDLLSYAEKFSKTVDDDLESGIRRLKHLIERISEKIDHQLGSGPVQDETPTGFKVAFNQDDRGGSGMESAGPNSLIEQQKDPIDDLLQDGEEVAVEEKGREIDEVEVIEEPEDVEVIDETQDIEMFYKDSGDGLVGAEGGGDPGTDDDGTAFQPEDAQVEEEALDEMEVDEAIEEENDSGVDALDEAGQGPTGEPAGRGHGMDLSADPEMGLPIGSLGLDSFEDAYQPPGDAQETDRKLLAETFDGYLGAMERFYNQYLFIPNGVYSLGGASVEAHAERQVELPAFYMGKFPVTNALFEIFVEKTGYRTMAEKDGYGVVYQPRRKKMLDEKTGRERVVWNAALVSQRVDGACWYQPLGPGSTLHRKRNHPVVQVSLEDAVAFAAWTGKRLPSEAEWEAASRSRDGLLYPWGSAWADGCCNVEEAQVGDTTPVDSYLASASPLGIADTLGNVMEWTLEKDQTGESGVRPCYIAKGGSWASASDICLWSRFKMEPHARSNILGFRCVAF